MSETTPVETSLRAQDEAHHQAEKDSRAEVEATLGFELLPNERVWFSAPATLPMLHVIHGRHSGRCWKWWHENYTVCLVHEIAQVSAGRPAHSYWRYRGRDHVTAERELMLMEPGEAHVTRKVSAPGCFDAFEVNGEYVQQLAGEHGLSTPVHVRDATSADPVLAACARRLGEAVAAGGDQLTLGQHLHDLVRALVVLHGEARMGTRPGMDKVQVRRAIDFMVTHHADDFSVQDLARACGASVSAVCHELPRAVGATPMKFRTLVRVARARDLLRAGLRPIDVAPAVGFYDQAALTRAFRDLLGTPPGAYRQTVTRA